VSGTDYVFDKFARTCDVCGTPRAARELQLRDGIAICISHPGYRTAKEIDKLNAQRRIPIPILPKYTRPLTPIPTWEVEEGRLFDMATNVAPFETFDTTSDGQPGVSGARSVAAAGWATVYLYALVTEGKRPAAWLARARTQIATLGDYLLTQQQTAASTVRRGGFGFPGGLYTATDAGVGCLALALAYQINGASKYLTGAQAACDFIVNLQAGDLYSFGSTPTPVLYGPPTATYNDSAHTYDKVYTPAGLVCAWAMTVVKGIAGDGTYGGPGTVGGIYLSAPARLLSVAIAQQLTFWQNGVVETGGTVAVNGLSGTTPRNSFSGATGTWDAATTIVTSPWAVGIRSLYEATGTKAASALAFLAALTANPANATPAGQPARVRLTNTTGAFSAATAPPTAFTRTGTDDTGALYDYASAGLLAPFVALSSLEATKEAIGMPRVRTAEGSPRDGRSQYLGRLGMSGYSFQPWAPDGTHRQESVTRACQTGLLYRVNPATMGSH
jgi:hypothetical protein